MKLTVITGSDGSIIGTARLAAEGNPDAGSGGPVAGPGQSVSEIDVPDEQANVTDPDDFHRRLRDYSSAR
jgi:hypothetical protein